jgi:hypothetical protein
MRNSSRIELSHHTINPFSKRRRALENMEVFYDACEKEVKSWFMIPLKDIIPSVGFSFIT